MQQSLQAKTLSPKGSLICVYIPHRAQRIVGLKAPTWPRDGRDRSAEYFHFFSFFFRLEGCGQSLHIRALDRRAAPVGWGGGGRQYIEFWNAMTPLKRIVPRSSWICPTAHSRGRRLNLLRRKREIFELSFSSKSQNPGRFPGKPRAHPGLTFQPERLLPGPFVPLGSRGFFLHAAFPTTPVPRIPFLPREHPECSARPLCRAQSMKAGRPLVLRSAVTVRRTL